MMPAEGIGAPNDAAPKAANAAKPNDAKLCKESFSCFVQELWPLAQQRGVSRTVFNAAFSGVSPDPQILPLTKAQPEYNRPIGQYVVARSSGIVAPGRAQLARLSPLLDRIEREFGVEREIIISIWGIETGFGAIGGNRDVIRSLATLAHVRYRGDFFRNELIDALRILQAGDVPRNRLVGSWAGAMGQPQFLPSSFIGYAIDFSGDGRRDIWTNVPDVLGSIARYLKGHGWISRQPWGFEVVVPQAYDLRLSRGTFQQWAKRGFRRSDGGELSGEDQAYLLFPSGASGPAFLVARNYEVIKSYNFSDPYALAVVSAADRMRGRPAWRGGWPPDDVPLSRDNRIALQRALAALCYFVGNFDGHIDFFQRDIVRELQAEAHMTPDGNPTATLVERVQRKAAQSECAAHPESR